MPEITKVKTSSHEEWLKLRSKYIGGSDAAAVAGLNPFCSPYSLWAEKTGRTPGFAGNLATEVGTYLEEFVAKKFSKDTGKNVRRVNASFVNSKYPWAIANIDREIVGEDAGLEIKTTSELNLKRFRGKEYPANYYVQFVHYMAVTGKKRWYLAVLIGNRDFKRFTIERDDAEIASLMELESEFWESVKKDIPPEIDGSQATADAIRTIYADSSEITVDLYGLNNQLNQYMALGPISTSWRKSVMRLQIKSRRIWARPVPEYATVTVFPGCRLCAVPLTANAFYSNIRNLIYQAITRNQTPACFGCQRCQN